MTARLSGRLGGRGEQRLHVLVDGQRYDVVFDGPTVGYRVVDGDGTTLAGPYGTVYDLERRVAEDLPRNPK